MKNIGACLNCFDEFIFLLGNGLCPQCQAMYEKRRVQTRKQVGEEVSEQLEQTKKLARDYEKDD